MYMQCICNAYAIEQQLAMARWAEPGGVGLQGLDAEWAASERAWTRVGAQG